VVAFEVLLFAFTRSNVFLVGVEFSFLNFEVVVELSFLRVVLEVVGLDDAFLELTLVWFLE